MTYLRTCRLCGAANCETAEELAKYGVRHHAHFSCGLRRWGAAFLDRIPLHEIGRIPYRLVDQFQLRQHPRLVEYQSRYTTNIPSKEDK